MRSRPWLAVVSVWFLVPSIACAQVAATAPAWAPAATAAIATEMQRLGIPGLSAAVGAGSAIVFSRGFGMADLENDVAAAPATVYRLASISKTVTAVLALQLAEQGKLDLDADVHTLLPAWPQKQWPVTTRQLLSHQGGVRHYAGEQESVRHYEDQIEALPTFANDPLLFEPGTRYRYSSYGFNLVAAVLEQVTGEPFAQLVAERIAGPCGAPTLRDDDSRALIRGRAQGYVRVRGELQNSQPMDGSYKLGGGGLCASAEDLARFAQALLADKLLAPATREQMWTRQSTRDGKATGYGLGFQIGEQAGHRTVGHGGAQARVSTVLHVVPDDGIVVVLLCNLEHVKLQPLAQRLAALVRQEGR